MDITIIIVNWNGGQLLHRCLESIRASRSSFKVRVIVVDNDSKDGSREAAQAEFPEFEIFNSGANLGFGRANNLARPRVMTPLILFLNPDTELRPDTLERCVERLRELPEIGVLGCKMRYPSGEVQEQGLQWFPSPWTILMEMLFINRTTLPYLRRWLPVFDPNRSAFVHKLYGGFLLGRREIIDRAGWFDDRYFMYAEDVDLCKTVLDQGSKLYYFADAEIVHVAGGVSAKAPSDFSILMKSESISKFMAKYHGKLGQLLYRFAILFGSSCRLAILGVLRMAAFLLPAARSASIKSAVHKAYVAFSWSMGLRHARPPSAPQS